MLSTFTDEIGRSIRLVELKLIWPVGKFQESFEVRSFVTKQDFSLAPGGAGGMPDLSNIDPKSMPNPMDINLGTGLKR